MSKKLASWHIFHKDAQVFGVLTDAIKADLDYNSNYDHGVIELTNDIALVYDMICLFGFNDLLFFHSLHAHYSIILFTSCKFNLAVGTLT